MHVELIKSNLEIKESKSKFMIIVKKNKRLSNQINNDKQYRVNIYKKVVVQTERDGNMEEEIVNEQDFNGKKILPSF